MADEFEQRLVRWSIIGSPKKAMEHDDTVCDWLALGACGIAAFVVSNFDRIQTYAGASWGFWLVGFLALSATSGLMARICAGQYFKIVSICESVSEAMTSDNFGTFLSEKDQLSKLLPFWYRPIQRVIVWFSSRDSRYLERRAVRLGVYQWLFSGIQKLAMLAFVVALFSTAYTVLVFKLPQTQ